MNIVILVTSFPPGPASGAELQAQAWAERLSARHRVTVITGREPPSLPALESRDGYSIHRLGDAAAFRWLKGRQLKLRSLVPEPVRHLRWKIFAGNAIARQVATIEPTPDVLLCFMTPDAGVAGVAVGRRLGIPAVVWVRSEGEYQLATWHHRRVMPDTWVRAAGVCVQSATGRLDLLRRLQEVSPTSRAVIEGKLEVIGNGVTLPEHLPLPHDGPVLSVGRLIPSKGMDVVIEACASLGRPLVIAGSGSSQPALEAQASALGAEVHFAGLVDHDRLATLYRSASVVVLASRREGMPNVILEAMAHGRPVVATPCGGIPELITDGVNGLLVPQDDPGALAAALDRLFTEPELAERLAAEARATAEGFAWESLQPKLEEALERWRRH